MPSSARCCPSAPGADWNAGEWVRAGCRRPDARHEAPHHACECGFHGLHTIAAERNASEHRVWGAMLCKGRLEVHHEGLRAAWARPIALGYGDTDRDAVVLAATGIGVAAVPLTHLLGWAKERGSVVVPSRESREWSVTYRQSCQRPPATGAQAARTPTSGRSWRVSPHAL